jgi:hypothetical protein
MRLKALNEKAQIIVNIVRATPYFLTKNRLAVDATMSMSRILLFRSAKSLKTVTSSGV